MTSITVKSRGKSRFTATFKAQAAALALASTLAGSAALAQTTPDQTPSSPPAAISPPSQPGASANPAKKPVQEGQEIFSSDQKRVGSVEKVMHGSDGRASAISFTTGGFLGFGARVVSVPEAKFFLRGDNVQLSITAEDVSKLSQAIAQ